jgi:hypothetical protein
MSNVFVSRSGMKQHEILVYKVAFMKYVSWNTLAKTALNGFYAHGRGAVYLSKEGNVHYCWEGQISLAVLFYNPENEFVLVKEWLNPDNQTTHFATAIMPLGSNVVLRS